MKELRSQVNAKSSEVSALKSELTQLNFNAKVEDEKSQKLKIKMRKHVVLLLVYLLIMLNVLVERLIAMNQPGFFVLHHPINVQQMQYVK